MSPRSDSAIAIAEIDPKREFPFSDADFRNLAEYAYQHTGIALSESKRDLVYNRLSRRLRALGLRTFREYHEFLEGPQGGGEKERFINSVSTNHTRFFREAHHFTHFRTSVAANFARAHGASGRGRMRVWSAGCSTGEEPYTIAMVLKKEIPGIARHDVRMLATDIDTEVLSKGARGEYSASALQEIPAEFHADIERKGDRQLGKLQMGEALRSLITFRQLNLMQSWPVKGPFDAIFCRNVMIYFDAPTKKSLVERFTKLIRPGGWLYIGHSESLIGAHPGLELVGRTIYRREP
ncbi:MAG TPA: protein-glutamate O-methyltransferase [Xanthobacteraceae bacterium]|nr:protein-glutamate O-methyltransferase [Xanthobacteraceae bacterium]